MWLYDGGCCCWTGALGHASGRPEAAVPLPKRAARSGFMNEREEAAASSEETADKNSAVAAIGLMAEDAECTENAPWAPSCGGNCG